MNSLFRVFAGVIALMGLITFLLAGCSEGLSREHQAFTDGYRCGKADALRWKAPTSGGQNRIVSNMCKCDPCCDCQGECKCGEKP